MKEMVGGCCVCSDERGWAENPLVYCDGQGCTVAVHQACYGIVKVPTGPWFCRKCESQERAARVVRKCELCPSKDGALKRTDNAGWAHVVCALYIPEVRFGNVTTMEPIILQLVPPDRFNKTCYICEEQGKENKSTTGACMQCNKAGCKQYFHVTCAQAAGLLCEEAGNYLDNVKYCGYCHYHYQKLGKNNIFYERKKRSGRSVKAQKKDGNIKTIPAFKPIPSETATPEPSPEKSTPPKQEVKEKGRGRGLNSEKKSKSHSGASSSASATNGNANDVHSDSNSETAESAKCESHGNRTSIGSKFTTANFTETVIIQSGSPVFAAEKNKKKKTGSGESTGGKLGGRTQSPISSSMSPPSSLSSVSSAGESPHPAGVQGLSMSPSRQTTTPSFSAIYESFVNGTKEDAETVVNVPLKRSRTVDKTERKKHKKTQSSSSKKKKHREKPPSPVTNGLLSLSNTCSSVAVASLDASSALSVADNLPSGLVPTSSTPPLAVSTATALVALANQPSTVDQKEGHTGNDVLADCMKENGATSPSGSTTGLATAHSPAPCNMVFPAKPILGTATFNGLRIKNSSTENGGPPPFPQTLEHLLERQWQQGSQFLMEQAQHFDIAALLSCLHQLQKENQRLEENVNGLLARRDHLLAVNARLALPLNHAVTGVTASFQPSQYSPPAETSRNPARLNHFLPMENGLLHGSQEMPFSGSGGSSSSSKSPGGSSSSLASNIINTAPPNSSASSGGSRATSLPAPTGSRTTLAVSPGATHATVLNMQSQVQGNQQQQSSYLGNTSSGNSGIMDQQGFIGTGPAGVTSSLDLVGMTSSLLVSPPGQTPATVFSTLASQEPVSHRLQVPGIGYQSISPPLGPSSLHSLCSSMGLPVAMVTRPSTSPRLTTTGSTNSSSGGTCNGLGEER